MIHRCCCYLFYLILLLFVISIPTWNDSGSTVVVNAFSPTSSFQKSKSQQGVRPQSWSLPPQLMVQAVVAATTAASSSSSTSLMLASSNSDDTSSSTTRIVDEVMDEMKRAMKEKDTITLNTIRLIRSSFANAVIELKLNKEENAKLNDLEAQNVLKKLAKMRKEAIDMYETNGAPDRAMIERNELAIISKWLPEVVTEDTLRQWVQAAIQTATSTTKAPLNMGKVMGLLMKEHKNDNMDGNMAQTIVKEEIAKLSAST